MTGSARVVETVKQQLRLRGITYKVLAGRLSLSESAIKHMFSTGNLSLKRLDEVCAVLELDIGELVSLAEAKEARIEVLSAECERELVADIRLLLVAYCLINYWTFEEILEKYQLTRAEGTKLLARLDRMKLIELQPDNRVRLLISNNFGWQKNGAIETFFTSQVQAEFFDSDFTDDGTLRIVKNGMLSRKGRMQLAERLRAFSELFDDATREERKLPARERQGTTVVLALRNWGFEGFRKLER